MRRFINRDWRRNESDDWKLNVQPYIGEYEVSVPVYDEGGSIIGWRIQLRSE